MAKTNPIGVRFNPDLLLQLKEDKIADTPQKALNFLSNFYHENKKDKPDFVKAFKVFDKKDLSEKKVAPFPQETKVTLDVIRESCPKELTGLDRSAWISAERIKYGV